nr:peptidoglycan-binding domain-containing protein [uncultured Gellertiella sp.]
MAPRKRKAPEKKGRSLRAALLSSTAVSLGFAGRGFGHAGRGLGRLAWRYPRPAAGAALFAIIFGAIAANALWYQPHRLTTPYLATRDASRFDALPGWHGKAAGQSADVTTYRIERADGVVVEGEGPQAATGTTPSVEGAGLQAASLPATASGQPPNVALNVAVQQALIRRGLYAGAADGEIGPRTSAAILFFQQTAGLPQTGEVSDALLQALAANGGGTSPPAAPARDPVAATIVASEVPAPQTAPPRPKKQATAAKSPDRLVKVSASGDDLAAIIQNAGGSNADGERIRQIQQGLIRMSYPDVTPDGVAGPSTRKAIRAFEKYYNLPITGEPSQSVLNHMRDFGLVPKNG